MSTRLPLEVRRALIGVRYPVSKAELVAHVVGNGGQPQVLALLRQLPGQVYRSEVELAGRLQTATGRR